MNTIQIETKGTDLETITITLDENQVSSIYEELKQAKKDNAELIKKLADKEQSLKYASEARTELQQELGEANTLLTALGVQEKTSHEESYYRKDLKVSTRIALYIATNK